MSGLKFQFPKSRRLLKRRDFHRVSASSERLVGRFIVVDISKKNSGISRLGLTVSRRYGSAIERNRFKRMVREAFRKKVLQFPQEREIVVKPRRMAKGATSCQIAEELLSLLHDFAQ